MLRASRVASVVLITLAVTALTAAPSRASGLDLRLGASFPRADSNLFRDDSELYTVDKSDWRGVTGGAEFAWGTGERFELIDPAADACAVVAEEIAVNERPPLRFELSGRCGYEATFDYSSD